jgi:hypothetical protein
MPAPGSSPTSVKITSGHTIKLVKIGNSGKTSMLGGTIWPTTFRGLKGIIIEGNAIFGSSTSNTLKCKGDIIAYSTSDARYKSNIIPINNPLEKLKAIGGYTFDWTGAAPIEEYKNTSDIGVLAQEIEAVLPLAVRTNEVDGVKSVRYEKIIPLLIECVKEQQKQISELNERLIKLESK